MFIKSKPQYQPKQIEAKFQNSTDEDSEPKTKRTNHQGKNHQQKCLDPLKYKTQICKNYAERGTCRFRMMCQYAHGYNELVQAPTSKIAYRKRRCNSFWNNGTCPYGMRCLFMHYHISDETRQYLQIFKAAIDDPEDGTVEQSQSRFVRFFIDLQNDKYN